MKAFAGLGFSFSLNMLSCNDPFLPVSRLNLGCNTTKSPSAKLIPSRISKIPSCESFFQSNFVVVKTYFVHLNPRCGILVLRHTADHTLTHLLVFPKHNSTTNFCIFKSDMPEALYVLHCDRFEQTDKVLTIFITSSFFSHSQEAVPRLTLHSQNPILANPSQTGVTVQPPLRQPH